MPFVPVLDGEVRRWYMADGLWQAQDDRLGVDEVFVIPGPEAVAGITRADEPVAALLARFEAESVARVTTPPVTRARLADPGPAPEPLASLRASGAVGELLAAQCVVGEGGRTYPNPLWRLMAPGDAIDQLGDVITVRPADAPFESVVIEPAGADVLLTAGALSLRYAVRDGAVFEVDGDAARAAFAVAALDPGATWTCPEALPRAYRAATGAAHDGVPLDLAWTLAWPAVCALLATPELAARFHELVHATHAVTPGPAWPPLPGETGDASAWLVELADPVGAPTHLRCRAQVSCARGLVATVEAELAILGDAAATSFSLRRHDHHDVELTLREAGDADFLAEQHWLSLTEDLAAGDVLRVRVGDDPGRAARGRPDLDRHGHRRARGRDHRDDRRRERRRGQPGRGRARPARDARGRAARAARGRARHRRGRRARVDGGVRAGRRRSQPVAPVGARGASRRAQAADRARRVDGGAGVRVRRRRAVRRRRGSAARLARVVPRAGRARRAAGLRGDAGRRSSTARGRAGACARG